MSLSAPIWDKFDYQNEWNYAKVILLKSCSELSLYYTAILNMHITKGLWNKDHSHDFASFINLPKLLENIIKKHENSTLPNQRKPNQFSDSV